MRDLANQSFSSSKGPKKNINAGILRLIIILVIIFGIGFFVKGKFLGSGGVSGSSDVVLREAPRGLMPVKLDGENVSQGKEIKSESASFRAVAEGVSGKVSASRNVEGGKYNIRVDATLEDPKQAYSYGVWLYEGKDEVLVDYLGGSGTNWYLRATRDADLVKYDSIKITREYSRTNESETILFEGSF